MSQPEPIPTTLLTLTYNGPVPYPHRAVTEPTPDDQYAEHVSKAEEEAKARDAAFAAEQEKAKSSSGGAMGKFSMFAKGVAHNMSKGATQLHDAVEAKVRQETKERDMNKFKTQFPDQAGSKYFCVYACKVMNNGQLLAGELFVSSTHLCFSSGPLRVVMPWSSILTIQRSVVLPTVSKGPPYILPIPAEHVIPQCLQLYTSDMKIYQFLDFSNATTTASAHLTSTVTGTSLERCYNFMDHAWRAACTVPQPGANYLPPPQ
eukprot:TRINITY_DN27009_c0_g1_i1.p1 TRINITY_DN27009_c0_g1~~TRINITY_DN27009_c0_g1_i1.p1  ORF type:complete len:280 (+),score=65.37 TRINITY_DN27009_c0_g1_i1:58-840(+)